LGYWQRSEIDDAIRSLREAVVLHVLAVRVVYARTELRSGDCNRLLAEMPERADLTAAENRLNVLLDSITDVET
jgi:hypothetical protein